MAKTKVKILIVDDSPTTRKIIRRSLTEDGIDLLDEASDGEQAWLKLTAAIPPFDLVIADWHMPNLSGLELLERIRASEKFKSLAVIMATAEANKEEVRKIESLGVTGYLIKPYETSALLSLVRRMVAKAR